MEIFKILGTIALEGADTAKKGLSDVSKEAKETKNSAGGAGKAMEKAGETAKKSSGGYSVLKNVLSNLVSSGFQRLTSAIGNFISSGIDYSKTIEQYQTSFAVMTGSEEEAIKMTERLSQIAAETPFELTHLADSTQLLMNYGFTAEEAIDKMTMLGDISQGNSDKMHRIATAYGQMSSAGKVHLEDVKQMIEAGFNPLQEISETTGESMESLYERISDGTLTIDEITAAMERSTSEGGKYFGSMDAQSKTLTGRLSTLKDTANESIGNILNPLLERAADEWIPKLTEAVGLMDEKFIELKETFQEIKRWMDEHETAVILIAIAVATFTAALIAYNIAINAATIGTTIATAATTAFGTVMAFVTSPITLVVVAIGALIAIIVVCVKHWDEIKAKALEVAEMISQKWQEFKDRLTTILTTLMSKALSVWESIKSGIQEKVSSIVTSVQEKFQAIKDAISDKLEAAKTTVKDAIETIKGFFNFEWKLPDIKLPHFEKVGETELGLPKIAVKWYAKGGVLEQPTIFGVNGGQFMGGGEAGPEAVAPIDVLQGYVAAAVASQNEGLIAILSKILDAIIAMDENMGGNLREALDGVGLDINNREFARLVRTVI